LEDFKRRDGETAAALPTPRVFKKFLLFKPNILSLLLAYLIHAGPDQVQRGSKVYTVR
jgi:hypothetical protein